MCKYVHPQNCAKYVFCAVFRVPAAAPFLHGLFVAMLRRRSDRAPGVHTCTVCPPEHLFFSALKWKVTCFPSGPGACMRPCWNSSLYTGILRRAPRRGMGSPSGFTPFHCTCFPPRPVCRSGGECRPPGCGAERPPSAVRRCRPPRGRVRRAHEGASATAARSHVAATTGQRIAQKRGFVSASDSPPRGLHKTPAFVSNRVPRSRDPR